MTKATGAQGLPAVSVNDPVFAGNDSFVSAPEASLVEAMASAWHLSKLVVVARAIKVAKKKGRRSSDDRMRRRIKDEPKLVLKQAAHATSEYAADPLHHAVNVVRYLHHELMLATRGPGRPKLNKVAPVRWPGMLSSVGQQRPREMHISPESSLRKFYGLKLRMYVLRRGLASDISLSSAIKHLRREAYEELGQRTPEAVTQALDTFVKDRAVTLMESAEPLFGASGNTLAKRIQRARKRVKVVLPLGAI